MSVMEQTINSAGGSAFDEVRFGSSSGQQASRSTRSFDMARLGETLTDSALAPAINGVMIWGTNPAVTQPDAGRVRRGLAHEDLFSVVVEHALTDTAALADVVLQSTIQLEHFDIQGAWGHHYVTANHQAVPPRGETKSHGEITRLLARKVGLEHPALFESDEEIAASALPEGVELSQLKNAGWIKRSPARPVLGAGGNCAFSAECHCHQSHHLRAYFSF